MLRPHFDALYRIAYRLTSNRHDAEDLVQDLFVKVCDRVVEFKKIEHPRGWMKQIMYRRFVDQVRRRKSSPVRPVTDSWSGEKARADPISEFASNDPGPHEMTQIAVRKNHILKAWQQLSDEHRTLVALHDFEGYTLPELSEMLEIPVGTLKSRLHRARARMRSLLDMEPF